MAVISIRKYLTDCCTDSTNPVAGIFQALLEGMIKAALAYDRQEYNEFSASLRKLGARLEGSRDTSELAAVLAAAVEAMEKYNRGAQNAHAAQIVELRSMIEMLSQTLVALAEAGGQSVQSLQNIRTQVEKARQLDDIRVLRMRLGDSLKAISDEAVRQRERNADILRRAEEAAQLAAINREDPGVDRVSGLPSPEKAESEMGSRLGADSRCFAAVFVVERVESMNLRYGYAAGDRLLQAFGQYLEAKLGPRDELYRWRGPSFLVLFDRAGPAEDVRAEVARFASSPQEYGMEVNGRPLKLPLTSAWTVVQLAKCAIAGQATQQIDRFVAEHWEKRS